MAAALPGGSRGSSPTRGWAGSVSPVVPGPSAAPAPAPAPARRAAPRDSPAWPPRSPRRSSIAPSASARTAAARGARGPIAASASPRALAPARPGAGRSSPAPPRGRSAGGAARGADARDSASPRRAVACRAREASRSDGPRADARRDGDVSPHDREPGAPEHVTGGAGVGFGAAERRDGDVRQPRSRSRAGRSASPLRRSGSWSALASSLASSLVELVSHADGRDSEERGDRGSEGLFAPPIPAVAPSSLPPPRPMLSLPASLGGAAGEQPTEEVVEEEGRGGDGDDAFAGRRHGGWGVGEAEGRVGGDGSTRVGDGCASRPLAAPSASALVAAPLGAGALAVPGRDGGAVATSDAEAAPMHLAAAADAAAATSDSLAFPAAARRDPAPRGTPDPRPSPRGFSSTGPPRQPLRWDPPEPLDAEVDWEDLPPQPAEFTPLSDEPRPPLRRSRSDPCALGCIDVTPRPPSLFARLSGALQEKLQAVVGSAAPDEEGAQRASWEPWRDAREGAGERAEGRDGVHGATDRAESPPTRDPSRAARSPSAAGLRDGAKRLFDSCLEQATRLAEQRSAVGPERRGRAPPSAARSRVRSRSDSPVWRARVGSWFARADALQDALKRGRGDAERRAAEKRKHGEGRSRPFAGEEPTAPEAARGTCGSAEAGSTSTEVSDEAPSGISASPEAVRNGAATAPASSSPHPSQSPALSTPSSRPSSSAPSSSFSPFSPPSASSPPPPPPFPTSSAELVHLLQQSCDALCAPDLRSLEDALLGGVLAEAVYGVGDVDARRLALAVERGMARFPAGAARILEIQPVLDHVRSRYMVARSATTLYVACAGTARPRDLATNVDVGHEELRELFDAEEEEDAARREVRRGGAPREASPAVEVTGLREPRGPGVESRADAAASRAGIDAASDGGATAHAAPESPRGPDSRREARGSWFGWGRDARAARGARGRQGAIGDPGDDGGRGGDSDREAESDRQSDRESESENESPRSRPSARDADADKGAGAPRASAGSSPRPAAHRGFVSRARALPLEALREKAREEGLRLVLCGHSLGGAVATLAALGLLQAEGQLAKGANAAEGGPAGRTESTQGRPTSVAPSPPRVGALASVLRWRRAAPGADGSSSASSAPQAAPAPPALFPSTSRRSARGGPVAAVCFAAPAVANLALARAAVDRGWAWAVANYVIPEDPVPRMLTWREVQEVRLEEEEEREEQEAQGGGGAKGRSARGGEATEGAPAPLSAPSPASQAPSAPRTPPPSPPPPSAVTSSDALSDAPPPSPEPPSRLARAAGRLASLVASLPGGAGRAARAVAAPLAWAAGVPIRAGPAFLPVGDQVLLLPDFAVRDADWRSGRGVERARRAAERRTVAEALRQGRQNAKGGDAAEGADGGSKRKGKGKGRDTGSKGASTASGSAPTSLSQSAEDDADVAVAAALVPDAPDPNTFLWAHRMATHRHRMHLALQGVLLGRPLPTEADVAAARARERAEEEARREAESWRGRAKAFWKGVQNRVAGSGKRGGKAGKDEGKKVAQDGAASPLPTPAASDGGGAAATLADLEPEAAERGASDASDASDAPDAASSSRSTANSAGDRGAVDASALPPTASPASPPAAPPPPVMQPLSVPWPPASPFAPAHGRVRVSMTLAPPLDVGRAQGAVRIVRARLRDVAGRGTAEDWEEEAGAAAGEAEASTRGAPAPPPRLRPARRMSVAPLASLGLSWLSRRRGAAAEGRARDSQAEFDGAEPERRAARSASATASAPRRNGARPRSTLLVRVRGRGLATATDVWIEGVPGSNKRLPLVIQRPAEVQGRKRRGKVSERWAADGVPDARLRGDKPRDQAASSSAQASSTQASSTPGSPFARALQAASEALRRVSPVGGSSRREAPTDAAAAPRSAPTPLLESMVAGVELTSQLTSQILSQLAVHLGNPDHLDVTLVVRSDFYQRRVPLTIQGWNDLRAGVAARGDGRAGPRSML